ncbi:polysaccharide deacetylase family protein [bacterium]|nr:polysaccharide deacetylase family protein [bacterium]
MGKKIFVKSPASFENERRYIFDVIFSEFLGLEYEVSFSDDAKKIEIIPENGTILLSDTFFSMDRSLWLKEGSMPETPLKKVDKKDFPFDFKSAADDIPVIYGDENPETIQEDSVIKIGIDIFGSAFFMLTRYEEVVMKDEKDMHSRFPATASLAFKEGFLTRPIVNEYVEILWSALAKLDPELVRKERKFEFVLTHDVDKPFKFLFMSPKRFVKLLAADLLKRRSFKQAFRDFCGFITVKSGKTGCDPYNTFNKIMDFSEETGVRSHFYFIAENYGKLLNSDYDLYNEKIVEIIENIKKHGHIAGLHVSYDAAHDAEKMKKEAAKFLEIAGKVGLDTGLLEARHHFLRVSVPESWRIMEECGIKRDLSLSFADYAGFRSGTCYEYPLFDLPAGKELNLIEIPLIVMECSVIDERYMNCGVGEKSFEFIKSLMNTTALFDGKFVLLWHNNRFEDSGETALYMKLLR